MLLPCTSTAVIVAVATASTQSAALLENQTYRIATTTNCWVKFGTNPTAAIATADNHYLAAGDSFAFSTVGLGSAPKVAVIRDTADGNVSISLATKD